MTVFVSQPPLMLRSLLNTSSRAPITAATPAYFALLAMGQSNMHGNSLGEGGDTTLPDKLRVWDWGTSRWITPVMGAWPLDVAAASGGYIVPLSIKIAREVIASTGREVRLIIVAEQATAIEAWITDAGLASYGWTRPVGDADLTATMYPGIATALATIGKSLPDMVAWHQGEDNQTDDVDVYRTKAWQMLREMAAAGIFDFNTTPFIAGGLVQGHDWHWQHMGAFLNLMDRGQTRADLTVDPPVVELKFADSIGCEAVTDNPHFTGIGTDVLARRYVQAMGSPLIVYKGRGLWTPVFTGQEAGGAEATGTTITGDWSRSGDKVTVTARGVGLDVSGLTGANDLYVTGLPFRPSGGQFFWGSVWTSLVAYDGHLIAQAPGGTNYVKFVESLAAGSASDFVEVNQVSGGSIGFTLTYTTMD